MRRERGIQKKRTKPNHNGSSNKKKTPNQRRLQLKMNDQSRIETCSCSNVNTLFASLFFFFGPMWPSHIKPHTKKQQQPQHQLNNTFYIRSGKRQQQKKIKYIARLRFHESRKHAVLSSASGIFLLLFRLLVPTCDHTLNGDCCCCYILFVCLFVGYCCCCCCLLSAVSALFSSESRCCSGPYTFITPLSVANKFNAHILRERERRGIWKRSPPSAIKHNPAILTSDLCTIIWFRAYLWWARTQRRTIDTWDNNRTERMKRQKEAICEQWQWRGTRKRIETKPKTDRIQILRCCYCRPCDGL